MKVAVSIPDDVFAEADRLAARIGTSRSAIYAQALTVYVRTHAEEQVTAAVNAVIDAIGDEVDPFVTAAAHQAFARDEW